MAACQVGQIELVTLLLSNGADVHQRGEVSVADLQCTTRQVDHPSRTHYSPVSAQNARTAMFYAALSGCVHCVQELLRRGAEVNLLDSRGHSPLLATLLFADHAAVVTILLRAGAQVNLVDRVRHLVSAQGSLLYVRCCVCLCRCLCR